MIKKINKCRLCQNQELIEVLDLGEHYLSGVFPPKKRATTLTRGPLKLVKCSKKVDSCGLLQLKNSYDAQELFGKNYGYRSGLNLSMSEHLKNKAIRLTKMVDLKKGDLVVDIGSNDGTTLGAYPEYCELLGIDPAASKFQKYYKKNINLITDFFTSKIIEKNYKQKKAKIITSFSMFYDLEEPLEFAKQIYEILDPKKGLWELEQSYMPLMLERIAYDTICHEHLEYYSLEQILWIAKKIGFKIIDIEMNEINGGSFSVILSNKKSDYKSCEDLISKYINLEEKKDLSNIKIYKNFSLAIERSKEQLQKFILQSQVDGKTISGIGASTKGNVLLQYCNITSNQIRNIGDVNTEKLGKFTPGSWIPIISESKVLEENPDFLLVLPWHFKDFFIKNPKFKNRNLVFPLPNLEVIKTKS